MTAHGNFIELKFAQNKAEQPKQNQQSQAEIHSI